MTHGSLVLEKYSLILLRKSGQFLSLFKLQFEHCQLKLCKLLAVQFPKNIFTFELDVSCYCNSMFWAVQAIKSGLAMFLRISCQVLSTWKKKVLCLNAKETGFVHLSSIGKTRRRCV